MTEKPELSDGHGRIANEIIEALARTYMSSYESQFLWCLFRKTYGWNKKDDWVSLSQVAEMTGMRLGHVSRTKAKLLKRRIVTQTGNKIAFNKYYSQWLRLPKQVTVTQTGNPSHLGNQTPPIQVITPPPKQEYTKDILTKDILQKTFATNEEASRCRLLAAELSTHIRNTNPAYAAKHTRDDPALVGKWAAELDKLIRIDKATEEQIRFVMTWLFTSEDRDALFWRKNIQSGATLRKQWQRLVGSVKFAADHQKNNGYLFIS